MLVRELKAIFSRVRFPKQVLRDQGFNFLSRVLVQLWQIVGIQPL